MDAEPTPPPAPPGPPAVRLSFGAIGRNDVLCIGPIVVLFAFTLALVPLAPVLVGTHPVLLAALRGGETDMVAVGAFARVGRASLPVALLAPVVTLMIADPFLYWAGRRYGRRFFDHLGRRDERWQRRVARGERLFARFGAGAVALAYFLPVPNAVIYLAAGESGMPFWLFIGADLAGTLAWIGLHVGAGWAAGQRAVDLAETVSRYGLWVSLGLVAVMVLVGARRGAAQARARGR